MPWRLNFAMIANDDELSLEQRQGVIAVRKANFNKEVKGPNAVKDVKKAQLFNRDAKYGEKR